MKNFDEGRKGERGLPGTRLEDDETDAPSAYPMERKKYRPESREVPEILGVRVVEN